MFYEGILQGFPNVRRYFGRVADYMSLIRPFTLVAPLLVGIFGSAIYLQAAFWVQWQRVLLVSITLALCQAIGQCINHAVGYGEDRINKPYRPIPMQRITLEESYGFTFLLLCVVIGVSTLIGDAFSFGILVILFFAIFYNSKPIQARKYLGLNLLWMSLSRGLLPLVVIWSAYTSPFVAKPWILGGIAFLWVLAFQPTKDFGDVKGDKAFGIHTLPVIYGLEKTQRWIKYASLAPFALLTMLLGLSMLPPPFVLLYSLLVFREIGLRGFGKKVAKMENDLSWIMFYLGLGFFILLSWIAEMI